MGKGPVSMGRMQKVEAYRSNQGRPQGSRLCPKYGRHPRAFCPASLPGLFPPWPFGDFSPVWHLLRLPIQFYVDLSSGHTISAPAWRASPPKVCCSSKLSTHYHEPFSHRQIRWLASTQNHFDGHSVETIVLINLQGVFQNHAQLKVSLRSP